MNSSSITRVEIKPQCRTRKRKTQVKENQRTKLKTETDDSDAYSHKEISRNVHPEEIVTELQATYDLSNTQPYGNQCIGEHEAQESEVGEADLHKYLEGCKKNPGHSQFIPVATFTLKHLPEGYQDIALFELIKAVADLTLRIDVKITSPLRPKFWPDTIQPYPFYE
ncbi:uncharacterized protein LOC106069557 isoform X2 [Biomphalaria glabrata]|nr:uncharacterized protein LOC106069557 isoform X2 [Biomphalaria glabrata]XP_055884256.1 uncharacterized protein LOC106069557 isoform X2 [Biomphalaria glabrata]XP_055884257.1 uncharacterized protein LOC106069557 isoform X2 [Biomphalaria glabrata]XP_055884258.1 uncharacterized protein LOC106069557 isoform X2 [Biomphalaria glabrata]XP_055884259.1 uncharacterized protein LOC106069557 isoform X2 [Biomphalaria glabrata]XP_055884260.1 uncharacterized protein LOC106069557 isoform X2 [Biomphalaria gla